MIDNDVIGLPTVLLKHPVTSFSREPGAGKPNVLRAHGDETGDTLGKYSSDLGDTGVQGSDVLG